MGGQMALSRPRPLIELQIFFFLHAAVKSRSDDSLQAKKRRFSVSRQIQTLRYQRVGWNHIVFDAAMLDWWFAGFYRPVLHDYNACSCLEMRLSDSSLRKNCKITHRFLRFLSACGERKWLANQTPELMGDNVSLAMK